MVHVPPVHKLLISKPSESNTFPTAKRETLNYPQSKQPGMILKAMLDYVIVVPALIFILPLLAILALAVKLDSPGPIIYRRRVLGKNGRTFDAFKFRTMYVDGEEILAQYPALQAELARNYKLKCDPRVTRVGALLRKFSLDELPNLFNVLRGQMSLVGPRPPTPDEVALYEPWHRQRLKIMPGMTGLWQVSGRSDIPFEEMCLLDIFYIENWSVSLDTRIMLQTIPHVLFGNGAY